MRYYQYTNRLAHLYFLRELSGLKANLIFIYFYNDKVKPFTIQEWEKEILVMKSYLGIAQHNKLSDWIKDIFINIEDIGLKEINIELK